METSNFRLRWLDGEYTIYRFSPNTPLPPLPDFGLVSINRTEDELSVLVRSDWDLGRSGDTQESGYLGFRIVGSLDFQHVGILAEISSLLAAAEIPILAVSTFASDYFLIPRSMRRQATTCLRPYWQ